MSLVRTTAKNIAYLLFARLGYRIATAVALITIARTVQSEDYGVYATALGWSSALLALNDLGLNTYLLKIASKKDDRFSVFFGNTLALQTILSVIICIGLTGLGTILYSPTLGLLMGVVSFGQLSYEFRKTFRAVFRSKMQLKSVALTEVSAGILFLIGVIILSRINWQGGTALFAFAAMSVIAQLINIIILGVKAFKLEKPTYQLALLPGMLKTARHFFVYNIGILLAFQIDQILISLLISPQAVSLYSAPAQIALLFLFIPLMVFQATTPLMFEWYENATEKYRKLLFTQWRYLTVLGIGMATGMALLSGKILNLVYGKKFFSPQDFITAQWMLALFALFLALRFFTIALMNALMTSNREDARMRYQIYAVLCNVSIDLILIPRIGPLGGAIATVITEILLASLLVLAHRHMNTFRIRNMIKPLATALLAACIMGILIILITPYLPVIVVVLLGASTYGLLLLLLRFFTPQDKTLFMSLRKSSDTTV